MKHTPGPWGVIASAPKVHPDGHDVFMVGSKEFSVTDMAGPAQAANDEHVVCLVPHTKGKYCDGNLRLIAAAPNLLEASLKLGDWMSAALEDQNVCEQMKSDINAWFEAIAKATGEA